MRFVAGVAMLAGLSIVMFGLMHFIYSPFRPLFIAPA